MALIGFLFFVGLIVFMAIVIISVLASIHENILGRAGDQIDEAAKELGKLLRRRR